MLRIVFIQSFYQFTNNNRHFRSQQRRSRKRFIYKQEKHNDMKILFFQKLVKGNFI